MRALEVIESSGHENVGIAAKKANTYLILKQSFW
jgi:hypothetical protein